MFDTVFLEFAGLENANPDAFPGGQLPGPGFDDPDEGWPISYGDYTSMNLIHEYSDLDYSETRSSLGFNYMVSPNLGLFGAVSLFDLDDDAPYLQDATGSVEIYSGGFTWTF